MNWGNDPENGAGEEKRLLLLPREDIQQETSLKKLKASRLPDERSFRVFLVEGVGSRKTN